MIGPALVTGVATDVVNVVGAGLLLAYGFAHFQWKNAQQAAVERRWRRRSGALLTGFAFYALVVATWGPPDSWVATVGRTIDSNIQQFATEIAVLGDQSTPSGPVDRVVAGIKLVGLVTYVALFGALSVSQSAVSKLGRSIRSLL
jgi:hypothetical protein